MASSCKGTCFCVHTILLCFNLNSRCQPSSMGRVCLCTDSYPNWYQTKGWRWEPLIFPIPYCLWRWRSQQPRQWAILSWRLHLRKRTLSTASPCTRFSFSIVVFRYIPLQPPAVCKKVDPRSRGRGGYCWWSLLWRIRTDAACKSALREGDDREMK